MQTSVSPERGQLTAQIFLADRQADDLAEDL
jgi:hypothetical protein